MKGFSTSRETESARSWAGAGTDLAAEKSGEDKPWEAQELELQEDGTKRGR